MLAHCSTASRHASRFSSVEADVEAAELQQRRALAGAELDAAVRDEVERRDALGDARRVVVARRHQHDAVAEPDLLGALRAGGEEDLRRRGVRVLLEEVVLDLPGVVDAELVGELDLVERVLEQPLLVALVPRPRQLVLVEDAEFHGRILGLYRSCCDLCSLHGFVPRKRCLGKSDFCSEICVFSCLGRRLI